LLPVWRPTTLRVRLYEAHGVAAHFDGKGGLHARLGPQFSYGRRLWENPGGRRENFDEEAAARMMAKLEAFCLQDLATFGHLPNGQRIENYVVGTLLVAEGVSSSYRIARERIVAPTLRKLRPPRRSRKL
jgi:hypothetical protein